MTNTSPKMIQISSPFSQEWSPRRLSFSSSSTLNSVPVGALVTNTITPGGPPCDLRELAPIRTHLRLQNFSSTMYLTLNLLVRKLHAQPLWRIKWGKRGPTSRKTDSLCDMCGRICLTTVTLCWHQSLFDFSLNLCSISLISLPNLALDSCAFLPIFLWISFSQEHIQ